jgi:hypothetical protein
MHDWPGRAHVESLRLWPDLVEAVERIESHPALYAGVLLLGSLSRGEGDAISDVDLVAVTHPNRWEEAWDLRHVLSAGALFRFDRSEGRPGVAGHSWLTPTLVRVECLITEPACMRLAGDVVALVGDPGLVDEFERIPPFAREEVDAYATEIRKTNAIPEIARAYDELIELLRHELRSPEAFSEPNGE